MIWMDNLNGMYAVAAIRGGGDYGEEWHEAGMKDKRQNVFDDLAFAAKYLHSNGLTDPKHTAINGGSNGGTVVAATANQNPDLFGAVVSDVPVTDMLRF
jgi:prolyl oligopeptidase